MQSMQKKATNWGRGKRKWSCVTVFKTCPFSSSSSEVFSSGNTSRTAFCPDAVCCVCLRIGCLLKKKKKKKCLHVSRLTLDWINTFVWTLTSLFFPLLPPYAFIKLSFSFQLRYFITVLSSTRRTFLFTGSLCWHESRAVCCPAY